MQNHGTHTLDKFTQADFILNTRSTVSCCRIMDAALKELTKLEKYTDSNSSSIHHALNSLLQALQDGKAALLAGQSSEDCLEQLATAVEAKKKEIDERQKELYTILSRLGKALDKVLHETITCGIPALTPWNIVLEISNTATILPRAFLFYFVNSCTRTDYCVALSEDRSIRSSRNFSVCPSPSYLI